MSAVNINISIEVDNIEVDEKYYSFDYKVYINGKLKEKDTYDSDHSWSHRQKWFKEYLEESGAFQEVIDKMRNELWIE